MVDIDRKELYEALQTIKEVCRRQHCCDCPMRADDDVTGSYMSDCALAGRAPFRWTLNEPSDWKAIL